MVFIFLSTKDRIKINNLLTEIYEKPANQHICFHEHIQNTSWQIVLSSHVLGHQYFYIEKNIHETYLNN